eukprot:c34222_g1_i1 orf=454-1356(+)
MSRPQEILSQRTNSVVVQLLFYLLLLIFSAQSNSSPTTGTANFAEEFLVTGSASNVHILDGGQRLQLSLDQLFGSGFASKNKYLFGNINMKIKLVPGDSAGTVTAYYLSSEASNHDEFDFEFLGNLSGQPYVLQTNVYANGVGGREQRIYLWFDPTTDFHTYTVSWTKQLVLFQVDGTPIRAFENNEAQGVPYTDKQPMGVYGSIWNGDSWATQGGRIKINWDHAPFIASFSNFEANACVADGSISACNAAANSDAKPSSTSLAANVVEKLHWVEENYMIYNYCTDMARYPKPPVECSNY